MQNFRINNATVDGGNLVLTLNGTPTIENKEQVILRFVCNVTIPDGSGTLPVVISIGGVQYPFLNRFGNQMTGDDLLKARSKIYYCPRFNYLTYLGTTGTPHFIAHNYPFKTCYYYI